MLVFQAQKRAAFCSQNELYSAHKRAEERSELRSLVFKLKNELYFAHKRAQEREGCFNGVFKL